GIRDKLVTGVQTCALPISQYEHDRNLFKIELMAADRTLVECEEEGLRRLDELAIAKRANAEECGRHKETQNQLAALKREFAEEKIGRASCRERVWMTVRAR